MGFLKNRKYICAAAAAALIAQLCFGLAGCTDKVQTAETPQSALETEQVVTAREGYKLVTDCVGRIVEVPENPERIAALDSFAGEAMVMIGAGEKMVAAPNGVKMDTLLEQIYPDLQTVGVPMSGGTINAESLMTLNPNLILLKSTMYEAEGEAEKIEKLDIPYLVIRYSDMAQQIYAIEMIGTAIGSEAEEKAEAICGYYRGVIADAQEIAEKIPDEDRVTVYHAINEVTRTDGRDSIGYDWITCVGAVNVSADIETKLEGNDYYAGMEQIFTWDPDVVICNESATAQYLTEDSKWTGLRAVKENRIYNIPVAATRWGQRGSLETFFAILWLGKTIYPEYYADIDLKSEVFAFYRDYLGITLDDIVYDMILRGEGIRGKSLTSAGK